MNYKDIKQVVDLMKRSEISEFEIEEDGLKLRIKRGSGEVVASMPQQVQMHPMAYPMQAAPQAAAPVAAPAAAAPVEEAGIELIKSPMVGTFYSSPSPESPAFVSVGDVVKADTVVCIVEAMKVMNEIQADLAGKITEVLVKNGDSIEYGQPLFKVKA